MRDGRLVLSLTGECKTGGCLSGGFRFRRRRQLAKGTREQDQNELLQSDFMLSPRILYTGAMPPLHPDQATFLLHMTLSSYRNEHTLTKRVIEAIPLDKGDYRPDAVSKSALELAWHIASTEQRFLDAVAAGEFNLSPSPMPGNISVIVSIQYSPSGKTMRLIPLRRLP